MIHPQLDSASAHQRSEAHQASTAAGPGVTTSAQGRGEPEGGRLSPNSLINAFSANLNYLESMEESLRQLTGVERARAVALAQQETVSVAQVLKARQQEHQTELRTLQDKAHREVLEANQQLEVMKGRPRSPASLLETEDNRRPDSRSYMSRSELSQSPGNRRSTKRGSTATSLASVTKVSYSKPSSHSGRDSHTTSVKTAIDSSDHSDSSIRTASDLDGVASAVDSRSEEVPEEIGGEDDDDASYSMSFDESITDEESFRAVLPSESHRRKELRRQSGENSNASNAHDVTTSHVTPYGDLSSLFVGEDSFNKFTAEMVRQVMREEEYRAQHQAALLKLREKALKEKARAELAWLQQLKQQPRDKRADDVFPNLDKKEKIIRKHLQEQQEEIRRLQEANKVASEERQRLLQQHEQIARIKQKTQATLGKLKGASPVKGGRLERPSEVHTEDEIEEQSDVSEDLTKSDTEMYRSNKSNTDRSQNPREKMQKLRLGKETFSCLFLCLFHC